MPLNHCSGSVEEITTLEGLLALRSEWNALWERCLSATPFQSPDWLVPWWKYFGTGKLWVLALRRDGRLDGLAPLFISNKGGLSLLGEGISDYLDFLVAPSKEGEAVGALLDYIVTRDDRWGMCELNDIRSCSPLLRHDPPSAVQLEVMPGSVCPVLPLPPTVDSFIGKLPKVQQRNLLRGKKLLASSGTLKVGVADEKNLSEYLLAFFELHTSRWNELNLPGVLNGSEIRSFHFEAATGLISRGCLRLYGLWYNDSIKAILYSFFHRGTAYYYLGGFDPELKRFSPGTVIIGHAIMDAIEEGIREFDFLRGSETYKYLWGGIDRKNYRLIVRHSTVAALKRRYE